MAPTVLAGDIAVMRGVDTRRLGTSIPPAVYCNVPEHPRLATKLIRYIFMNKYMNYYLNKCA